VLEVTQLHFAYPDCEEIIKGVTFSLARGRRLAIAGPNGSGKTTLARLLCGLLQPTSGMVSVDGLSSADADSVYEVRRRVGLVFQDPDDQMVETTVEREIAFGPRHLGLSLTEVEERVGSAISLFGLDHLRKRSCHLLSAGEKQTLAIASVFAMRPDYVVLDESTSLLDGLARRQAVGAMERMLDETGAGLVFISMRLEDIWTCERVVFLDDGSIVFEGGKADYLEHLRSCGLPLSGTALFLDRLREALPGFVPAIARGNSLSADVITSALVSFKAGGTCQS
jgi:energy-coupling factor transporter ATP-binding protein EcfA2